MSTLSERSGRAAGEGQDMTWAARSGPGNPDRSESVNVTLADLRRHALLPLGELHSEDACALCGSKRAHLQRTVIVSTRARGMRCLDTVGCVRRRQRLAA